MDSATARQLPDAFLQTSGTSIERTLSVVCQYWGSASTGEQRQLAQALLALLDPLLATPQGTVSDALRDECARTVHLWQEGAISTRSGAAAVQARTVDRTAKTGRRAGAPRRRQRAMKFISIDMEYLAEDRCRARVALERGGTGSYQGAAEGSGPDAFVRCAAQATADAVGKAVAGGASTLAVNQTTIADAFGRRTVFVEVAARHHGEQRTLLGFCVIEDDPARAAALAVLNATNRFLDLN
ncbi:MAG: hypothetical protein HY700_17925 [Gemmatimonadetes bacterium]|nr:hypothetical protein [Gemmatimonadota bacterium]